MDGNAMEVTVVIRVRMAHPFSCNFWCCLHWDSSSLQWVRRDWCVSWYWSWRWMQSLASWYGTVCCRTMIFSISCVLGWGNLHWEMRVDNLVDRAWIPSSASWWTLERSSSQKYQKCSPDLIVVSIASRASWGSSVSPR